MATRTVRAEPDRGPPPRAACGRRMLAWLFARSAGQPVPAAGRGPRPGDELAGARGRPARRPRGAGPRLGRPGRAAVGAARRARGRARRAGRRGPHLSRASAAAGRSARRARRRTRRPASTRAPAGTSPPPRSPSARPRVGRPPLRLRGDGEPVTIVDRLRGEVTRPADDIVLRRNDGVPAYHVAVVVDDDDQGVEEVVRADDLLDATPSQAHLLDLLGRPRPAWAHVPARARPRRPAPGQAPRLGHPRRPRRRGRRRGRGPQPPGGQPRAWPSPASP